MKFLRSFLLIYSLATILLSSCSNNQQQNYSTNSPKTTEEIKLELENKELQEPTLYLEAKNTSMNENVIQEATLFKNKKTDGWIVKGDIVSSATLATFKDVVLEVKLFSQTETEIDSKIFTLYDYFGPRESKPFSLKVNAPSACKSYHISIIEATPANKKQ